MKAYFLLFTDKKGQTHEYAAILNKEKQKTRLKYIRNIQNKFTNVQPYSLVEITRGTSILINAILETDDLRSYADVLNKTESNSSRCRNKYIPTIIIGTHRINKEDKLLLAFTGHVLSKIQKQKPAFGYIVGADSKTHRIKLEPIYKVIDQSLKKLMSWIQTKTDSPPLLLNKHCPYCRFQNECKQEARGNDHLSLIQRMSEREIITQNKRGIFTVTQFSFTFRHKKKSKKILTRNYYHSLKALAIKDNKIYVVERPTVTLSKVQIYFDVEGIPDQNTYYLIGVVVVKEGNINHFSLWADTSEQEATIYKDFINLLGNYDDFTLFHYGSYDNQFLTRMGKKYAVCGNGLELFNKIQLNSINVLSLIYRSMSR
jgi:predicted RecB family nuclease